VRTWRKILRPQAQPYKLTESASALKVIRGGAPGLRIVFDQDDQLRPDDNAEYLLDNNVIVHPWREAFIHWPANLPVSQLELELYDCATVVVDPRLGTPPPMRYTVLSRGMDVVLPEEGENLPPLRRALVGLRPESEFGDGRYDRQATDGTFQEAVRALWQHPSYVDGIVSSDKPFALELYAQLDVAGTVKALVASASHAAAANAITGRYDIPLSTGLTRTWAAGITSGLLPWPILGMQIDYVPTTAVAAQGDHSVRWLLWSRSLQ
jgi:hypothetical protein